MTPCKKGPRVRLRYYAEGALALAALVPLTYGALVIAQVLP